MQDTLDDHGVIPGTLANAVQGSVAAALCVVTVADRAVAFVRGMSAPDDATVQVRAVRWPN